MVSNTLKEFIRKNISHIQLSKICRAQFLFLFYEITRLYFATGLYFAVCVAYTTWCRRYMQVLELLVQLAFQHPRGVCGRSVYLPFIQRDGCRIT